MGNAFPSQYFPEIGYWESSLTLFGWIPADDRLG
jgi:hypothetical protein